MAKNKVYVDVIVDDKGTTKKVALSAKQAAKELDGTGRAAQTADRNLKGTAQASANSTKNFAKMSQGITTGLVPAYATLAANVFALSAAFNFLKNAADLANLEKAQITAAQNTGVAMDRLTDKLRKASQGMLNFQDAASASAVGVAKGFSSLQMEKLAEGALKVSNVMGRDFKDSFDRLVRGVSKAEPELLDELGVTLRLETATQRYADSLNKSAKALTDAERSQAVYLETMRQLEQVTTGQEGVSNPFIELGATFSDLIKDLTQFFLPALSALANFINANAAAALLFFGGIGLSILKSMPFVDDLKGKVTSFVDSQKEGLDRSKAALEDYRKKLQEVKRTAVEKARSGSQAVQAGAREAISGGAQSRVLMRAATGTMQGADRANLKKALQAAEKDYLQHGKITKGIFKNMSIEIVRTMDKGFKDASIKATTGLSKVERAIQSVKLRAKIAASTIKVGFTKAFSAAGKAAAGFGKAMNMAMKATVILGVIQMLYDMVMALINAPYTIITNIIGVGTKANTGEDQRKQAISYNETLQGIRDEIPQIQKSLTSLLQGKVFDETDKNYNPAKAMIASAKAISSLGIESLFEEALTIKDPEKQKKAIREIGDSFKDELTNLSGSFAAAVEAGDANLVKSLVAQAGSFTANIADAEDKLNNLGSLLQAQGSSVGVRIFAENLVNTGEAAVAAGNSLNLTTDIVEKINKAFEDQGGINGYIESLKKVESETEIIAKKRNQLAINRVQGSNAPGAVGSQQALKFTVLEEELALREAINRITEEGNRIFTNPEEIEQQNIRLANLTREKTLQEEKLIIAKRNMTELGQIGNAVGDSLASSMQSAFDGLIQGTMTAKEAFGNMAKSMLQSIAKVISELLVAKLLTAALGGSSSFGGFLGIPAGRDGGIFSQGKKLPGYATGGIARGSDAGYPAVLHGTEAVVPLPNNRSIPVDLKGAGQQNNVTVNVSVDGNGNAQQDTQASGNQAASLGNAIAAAVQKELLNQKRNGGILSPYGVA